MNEMKRKPNPEKPRQSAGFDAGELTRILFKHKWMASGFALAGIVAAAVAYLTATKTYYSEAKLLVKYVLETKSDSPASSDSQVKSPDSRGESIINTEQEILTSRDLAMDVVRAIGADKILAKVNGKTNSAEAAAYILNNLNVEVGKKSTVMRVMFTHPDPGLVQPVLNQLVESYLNKHLEIHRSVGILDEFQTGQRDKYRTDLELTEQDLRKLKAKAGVISLEDSKKAYVEQVNKYRSELLDAEAQLAERQALLAELQKNTKLPGQNGTNGAVATGSDSGGALTSASSDSMEKISRHKNLVLQLETLRKMELEMQIKYSASNPILASHHRQIADLDAEMRRLEAENPQLALLSGAGGLTNSLSQTLDPAAATNQIIALISKTNILNNLIKKVQGDAIEMEDAEVNIRRLMRQKEVQEANYRFYSSGAEQAQMAKLMGSGRISNINKVETPTPAAPFIDKTRQKIVMGLAAAGIILGIGLSLLIEIVFNQSVRKKSDVEDKLQLPVFITIPEHERNGKARHVNGKKLVKAGNGESEPPVSTPAKWSEDSHIQPYLDALRDRLLQHLEGVAHKPKLVAVTSCNHKAGVTTISTGLAAALSQTGDGNVLVVDMQNSCNGAAHPFHMGRPVTGLMDALEMDKREAALIDENLYMVSGAGANGTAVSLLPRNFSTLVPKLKASDYDYIIFDMPPVSQTSLTARLSGFMDVVLLVAESDKTSVELFKQASRILSQSKADVAAVINKTKSHTPSWFNHELQ